MALGRRHRVLDVVRRAVAVAVVLVLACPWAPFMYALADEDAPAQIVSAKVYYRYVDAGEKDKQERVLYEASKQSTYPEIYLGRTLRWSAELEFDDNSTEALDEDSELWEWSVEDGSGAVAVGEDNVVSAVANEEGSAKLTFKLKQYTGFEAQTYTVKVQKVPEQQATPTGVSVSYMDASHASETAYRKSSLPQIAALGNMVQFYPTVSYTDGSTRKLGPNAAPDAPACTWKLVSVVDYRGKKLTSLKVDVSGSGRVTASGSGNGVATLSMSLDEFPGIGEELKVEVQLDSSQPVPFGVVLYTDAARTKPYTQPLKIATRKGAVRLYPSIRYKDGSTQAAERDDVSWSLTSMDEDGTKTDAVLATCAQTGVVRATGFGNGQAEVTCSLNGTGGGSSKALVLIGGNEPTPVALDLSYTDETTSKPTAYNPDEGAIPEIRSKRGKVRLIAEVAFDNASIKPASEANIPLTWTIEKVTNLAGETLAKNIATVNNGYVFATGIDNGIVYVGVAAARDPGLRMSAMVHIRGNDNIPYVTKVEVLNAKGKPYGDDSAELQGAGVTQFYARVTYSDGTVKSTYKGDYVEGLEWGPSSIDGANINATSGLFIALPEFRTARVTATVAGGGFYGQDVKGRVWVMYDPAAASGGKADAPPADSLRVKVLYESDYRAAKLSAKPVYDKTYSLSFLESLGARYYTYTFSRGPNSVTGAYTKWGTMTSYGISFSRLLSEAGVPLDNLQGLYFTTTDNYNPQVIPTERVFGLRWRYPNFSIGVEAGRPSAKGKEQVESCLAFSSFVEYDTDEALKARDYDKLSASVRFRVCYGLGSVTDSNTFGSARNVREVYFIVKDASYGFAPDDSANAGAGIAGGSGDGSGTGGTGGTGAFGPGGAEGVGGAGAPDGAPGGVAGGSGNVTVAGGMGTDRSSALKPSQLARAKATGGAGEVGARAQAAEEHAEQVRHSGATPEAASKLNLREITSADPGDYNTDDVYGPFTAAVSAGACGAVAVGAAGAYLAFCRRRRFMNPGARKMGV